MTEWKILKIGDIVEMTYLFPLQRVVGVPFSDRVDVADMTNEDSKGIGVILDQASDQAITCVEGDKIMHFDLF